MLNPWFFSLATFALFGAAASGAAACEALRPGPAGIVASVTDGDTVILVSGRVVRLIGIQAPKLPLGREGFETWPLAEQAKLALEAMALGAAVRLDFGGEVIDRHGRTLAHMFVEGPGTRDVWVQEAMLGAGLARVYSFPDNRLCLDGLLAAEGRARIERLGIWSDPYYAVRRANRPATLLKRQGHYEVVEGRVVNAARAGSRIYLNFGEVWKTDFTAVIERTGQKLFERAGRDPLVLEGALVRIRGWVDERDGPRINITHPEQIEVIALK